MKCNNIIIKNLLYYNIYNDTNNKRPIRMLSTFFIHIHASTSILYIIYTNYYKLETYLDNIPLTFVP